MPIKIAAEIQGDVPNMEAPKGADMEVADSSALADIDFDDGTFWAVNL